jgi:AcrR family transcriptional regulator
MARRSTPPTLPPRKRRTADEARHAILDVAEKMLVAEGPGAIRLQEVAAKVGVSHPTILHHFGSREGLLEAVVARALESLHASLLAAVKTTPESPDRVADLLDGVYATMVTGGHARAFLWLALSGYTTSLEQLRVRSLAEAVHEIRRTKRTGVKRIPPFEDTYFSVLLPALALVAMSATTVGRRPGSDDEPCSPKRFRAWLAKLIHEHLEVD